MKEWRGITYIQKVRIIEKRLDDLLFKESERKRTVRQHEEKEKIAILSHQLRNKSVDAKVVGRHKIRTIPNRYQELKRNSRR